MRYDIEPLRITGANVFGRTSAERSGVNLKDVEVDNLEEVFRSMPSLSGFYLTAKLQISFEAKVLRNFKPGREIVRFVRLNNGRSIDLLRDVAGEPGDIGVSCNPDGDEVSVDSINIKFRDYEDNFTDRGIVWVFPGDPASIRLFIKAKALKTVGKVAEIVTAAEESVKTKVLAHF